MRVVTVSGAKVQSTEVDNRRLTSTVRVRHWRTTGARGSRSSKPRLLGETGLRSTGGGGPLTTPVVEDSVDVLAYAFARVGPSHL